MHRELTHEQLWNLIEGGASVAEIAEWVGVPERVASVMVSRACCRYARDA